MAKKKKTEDSAAEMVAKARQLEREVFDLRNTLAVERKLEKPHLLKAKRHERARILTALTKQQRGQV